MLFKKILLFIILSILGFSSAQADSEENIKYHLNLVENVLREVDTSHLSEQQKENRVEKLDILSEYTQDSEFPNNDINNELTSIFRGSNGNLCAVGYLMYSDEEYRDYVDNVVSTNNLVRVAKIENDPIFTQWANENGFSQTELAMIQPTYGRKDTKVLNGKDFFLIYIFLMGFIIKLKFLKSGETFNILRILKSILHINIYFILIYFIYYILIFFMPSIVFIFINHLI